MNMTKTLTLRHYLQIHVAKYTTSSIYARTVRELLEESVATLYFKNSFLIEKVLENEQF